MIFTGIVVFAVTLAVVTGTRLAQQALVVAFGIAVGVAVGVPTSMLVASMTRQGTLMVDARQATPDRPRQVPARQLDRNEREFTIVGGVGPPILDESFGNGSHG